MILETRHLRMIVGIDEYGTLTRAASHLNITQSGLSHQLLELEARLGTALFQRVGKRMLPTTAGRRLLAVAQETLPRLEQAEEGLRLLARGQEAVLRLSTECYTCYHWLPRVMPSLLREFPALDIQVVPEATQRPIAALLDGTIDVGIVHTLPDDARLRYHRLFEDELVALMPPAHPLADRRYVEARDLDTEHLLLYDIPRHENSIYSRFLDPAGVSPRRISTLQLTEAILELVRAGMGVTIMARWAATPQLAAGALVARPLTRRGLRRVWCLAMLRQDSVPEHIRRFIDLLSSGPVELLGADPAPQVEAPPRLTVTRGGASRRRLARHGP